MWAPRGTSGPPRLGSSPAAVLKYTPGLSAPPALFFSVTRILSGEAMSNDGACEANKKLVLEFMRRLVDPATSHQAAALMTESYIQHNPNIASGRQAIIDWTQGEQAQRARTAMRPVGKPFLVAEGDRVVMMLTRELPHPHKPGETYLSYWFDMWRIEDGRLAEHWDGAPLE
jgi:predicted SnoaL-like aldol condensation-catalyzing enzyme